MTSGGASGEGRDGPADRRRMEQAGSPGRGIEVGSGAGLPGPDAMLGVWTSWVEAMSGSAGRDWADPAKPWWQVTTDDVLGGALAGGTKQLNDALAKDPLLRSVDRMWNANPLRDVAPVDWAEVARALRTVWLRSLGRPGDAMAAAAELNADLWRSAVETWNEAGRRWWEGTAAEAREARRRRRQAVRRAGVAHEPRLPHAEGSLPARLRLAAEAGRGAGGRHGRGGAPAARLPPPPVRGRHEPDPAARLQPGGAAPRDGDRRREPRRRRAQPGGRPEGRAAQHGGRGRLRARAQPRPVAGQGGPPQPPDRADPVRADDGAGAPDAAADLPALDQQVLHPRHAAEEQHGAPPGGPGLHRVHGILEEPGRFHGGRRLRGLHGPRPARSERRGARDHRGAHRQRDGLLHRRHAARHDPRLAGREEGQAVQRRDLHGLDAGLLAGRRHRRLHGRAGASTWSSSR